MDGLELPGAVLVQVIKHGDEQPVNDVAHLPRKRRTMCSCVHGAKPFDSRIDGTLTSE